MSARRGQGAVDRAAAQRGARARAGPNDPALAGTSVYAQAVVAEAVLVVSSGERVLFGSW